MRRNNLCLATLFAAAALACDGEPPTSLEVEIEESITGRVVCDPDETGDWRLAAWVTIHGGTPGAATTLAATMGGRVVDKPARCVLLFDVEADAE